MRHRLILAAAAIVLALGLPVASAGASIYSQVLRAYETNGSIPPCQFTSPQLQSALKGIDSLLSIVQMPAGVPVATLAIGKAGAINAALLAAAILALSDPAVAAALDRWRARQTEAVAESPSDAPPA